MRTITFIEKDEVKREQQALEIVSRFSSPFLATWVLKTLANGKIAKRKIRERARMILDERAHGTWVTLPDPPSPIPLKSGYVYLIKASNGLFKIGKAKNIKDRLKILNTMCACKLELICAIYSDKPYALERRLHNQYAEKRSHGEWFALAREDIESIKGIEQKC